MELIVIGHGGPAVLVFPTSMGRFFEYEDRGMVNAAAGPIEAGNLTLFCVDSVDSESWYNRAIHPRSRVQRHLQYERYILDEVLPLMHHLRGRARIGVTGCSFGGYHAANLAFKHPEVAGRLVSMSGAFDIRQFLDGYFDDNAYFSCPQDYLPALNDPRYLDAYRAMDIVLAAGEQDICLEENVRLSGALTAKGVPHTLDIWSDGARHDWPWWQKMAAKFFV